MKISIIIPTNRKERLLDFELPSFARQTFPIEDFEVVIIDDYPDSRQQAVEEFAKKNDMNIKWMRCKKPYYRSNFNAGCARNTGLVHAEGELVVFIDDYSCIKQLYLETMWQIYKENPGYSPIGGVVSIEQHDDPYYTIYGMKVHVKDLQKVTNELKNDIKVIEAPSNAFYTSNASAPLREIMKVNGFLEMADLTREEDVILGAALAKNGWKFVYVNSPEASVYHMKHSEETYRKYKTVTYKDLGWDTAIIKGRITEGGAGGGWSGLQTKGDEMQLITKDIFNTTYPASWGLIEFINNSPLYKFNMETGFDLVKERKKIGNWT